MRTEGSQKPIEIKQREWIRSGFFPWHGFERNLKIQELIGSRMILEAYFYGEDDDGDLKAQSTSHNKRLWPSGFDLRYLYQGCKHGAYSAVKGYSDARFKLSDPCP